MWQQLERFVLGERRRLPGDRIGHPIRGRRLVVRRRTSSGTSERTLVEADLVDESVPLHVPETVGPLDVFGRSGCGSGFAPI
jgi:hypothetical protein